MLKDMRLLSWNVNGLRSVEKNKYWDKFLKEKPDIFCLQETKASPEQLSNDIKNVPGYTSYFSSSQVKKGYSGVATYTKTKPDKVEYGMNIKHFDEEGRMVVTHFPKFILFCFVF